MKNRIIALVVGIVLLLLSALSGQGFYPDSASLIGYTYYHLSETGGPRNSVRDSQGWIHAVWGYRHFMMYADSDDVFYSFSTDNGVSWSSMINISQTDSTPSQEPTLAIDSQDNLHCVWKQYAGGYDIFYSKYNGISWSDPENISKQYSSSNTANYPALVVDSKDYLHVVWDKNIPPGDCAIFYSYYNDTTWSTPYQISQTSGDDAFPALAVDKNDILHVVWRKMASAILYRTYDGSSWTWRDPLYSVYAWPFHPSIVIDSQNNPVVVFQADSPYDTSEIYISKHNGVEWSQPFCLSDGSAQSRYPSIAIDSLDKLFVVWDERMGDPRDIFFRSYDGTSWSNAINLTQDSMNSDYPELGSFVKANNIDLIWTSGPEYPQIRELLYMALNATGISEENINGKKLDDPAIVANPNPFTTSIRIELLGAHKNNQPTLTIYDVSGRRIRDFILYPSSFILGATWNGRDAAGMLLPPGIYFLKLNGKPVGKVVKVR
jgi:hypothetical protein